MSEENKFRPCDCCLEPLGTTIDIEYVSLTVECKTDTCGYLDPQRPECDKTYYSTETIVDNFLNGATQTTTRTKNYDEFGVCRTTVTRDCDAPEGLDCAGLATSTRTYSEARADPLDAGTSVGYIPNTQLRKCSDISIGTNYPPYRYVSPSFKWTADLCGTQDWPLGYEEDGTPVLQSGQNFLSIARSYNLLSNLCPFGFNEGSSLVNVKFRLRHYATATCYLKVWIKTRKQNQILVERFGNPCCFDLTDAGPPEEEIIEYVWNGDGRPCYKFDNELYTNCSNVIYSEDYFLTMEEFDTAVKTASILKWSYLPDYVPNDPDQFGDQGEKTNGFPRTTE